jgi:hypothetical protein
MDDFINEEILSKNQPFSEDSDTPHGAVGSLGRPPGKVPDIP